MEIDLKIRLEPASKAYRAIAWKVSQTKDKPLETITDEDIHAFVKDLLSADLRLLISAYMTQTKENNSAQ